MGAAWQGRAVLVQNDYGVNCKLQAACCAMSSSCVLKSLNYRLAAFTDKAQKVLQGPTEYVLSYMCY